MKIDIQWGPCMGWKIAALVALVIAISDHPVTLNAQKVLSTAL